ncbi:MAG: hypothetical protein IJG34_11985 [Synergistaceae bacterium]|nr:hypothetical protein [Synergistaceae bacterium]MBQ3450597.1 hypothetical protein [Synergistaceae bacterium]
MRKGFTLMTLLIVIVVIGVISAMMMLSSTETISTAKAARVIANLHTLRKAVEQWYADNRDKVEQDGRVNLNVTSTPVRPVQEWEETYLQLGRYIDSVGNSDMNIHMKTTKVDPNTGKKNTYLKEGCYGVCDGGTLNGFHRNAWYVGYCFKDDEGKVREKIRGRMKSSGVFFGTPDAHKDTYNDNSAAVWLRVF